MKAKAKFDLLPGHIDFDKCEDSAFSGDAHSQYLMGCLYEDGERILQSYPQAQFWYLQAAEQGNTHAQCNLGDLYQLGLGVHQDYRQAFYWYSQAAEADNTDALFRLARLYELGAGTDVKFSERGTASGTK